MQIADPQVAQELLTAAGQFDQDATHVIGRDGLQLGKRADIVLQRSADPLLVLSDVKIGEQSQ